MNAINNLSMIAYFSSYIITIIVSIVMMIYTFFKLKKEEPKALKFFFLRLLCIAITILSGCFNAGYIWTFLLLFGFFAVHTIIFGIINGLSMRKLSKSPRLKWLITFSYITYVAGYILLPDSDYSGAHVFFGLIQNSNIKDVCQILSIFFFSVNIIIFILQIIELAIISTKNHKLYPSAHTYYLHAENHNEKAEIDY